MVTNEDGPSAKDFERLSRVVEKLTYTLEELPQRMAEIYVRKDVYLIEQERQDEKIDGLDSIKDWAIKIVLGMVLVALTGLVLTQTGGT